MQHAQGRRKINKILQSETLKVKEHFKDLGSEERVIFNCILKKQMRKSVTDLTEFKGLMAISHKHSDEPSGSIKDGGSVKTELIKELFSVVSRHRMSLCPYILYTLQVN
jgi:hypothetical protein